MFPDDKIRDWNEIPQSEANYFAGIWNVSSPIFDHRMVTVDKYLWSSEVGGLSWSGESLSPNSLWEE